MFTAFFHTIRDMVVVLTPACLLLNTSVIVSSAAPSPRGVQIAPSAQELCDQLANSPIDEAKSR